MPPSWEVMSGKIIDTTLDVAPRAYGSVLRWKCKSLLIVENVLVIAPNLVKHEARRLRKGEGLARN
jgi:hypothetical protein